MFTIDYSIALTHGSAIHPPHAPAPIPAATSPLSSLVAESLGYSLVLPTIETDLHLVTSMICNIYPIQACTFETIEVIVYKVQ